MGTKFIYTIIFRLTLTNIIIAQFGAFALFSVYFRLDGMTFNYQFLGNQEKCCHYISVVTKHSINKTK